MSSTPSPPSTDAPAGPSRRGIARLVVAGVVVLGLLVVLQAPLPAYILRPGPAFGLADTIDVPQAEPIRGDFLFLTIRLDDATAWSALAAGFDDEAQVVTRDAVLGGDSEQEFMAEQAALFTAAEETAVAVGLDLVGSDIDPSAVTVEAEGVGGPSAGLLMALAVADLASEDDLAAGRRIAGTGAVDADGVVGSVGSVTDKVLAAEDAGATLFLVPDDLAHEARAVAEEIEVVGVETAAEAFAALGGAPSTADADG